jgi:hypothetical protein
MRTGRSAPKRSAGLPGTEVLSQDEFRKRSQNYELLQTGADYIMLSGFIGYVLGITLSLLAIRGAQDTKLTVIMTPALADHQNRPDRPGRRTQPLNEFRKPL